MVRYCSVKSACTWSSTVRLMLVLGFVMLPTPSRGQDQPTPAAYYVVGPKSVGTEWELFGEYDEKQPAIDSMKSLSAKGKRCTLLIMQIFSEHRPGALSIYEGKAYITFEDHVLQGETLVPARRPNVNKTKLEHAIRRALDPDAPKTFGEKLAEFPAMPRPVGRPVYLIAHRCNAPKEIERALKAGANAIECDVRFKGKDGWVVQHDPLAGATSLNDWLIAAGNAKAR